jgi:hypothetical protein
MLSRLLPASRRLAGTRIAAARPTVQAASFHAGPVLRDEEAAAAPAEEKGSFLLESLGDWNRAVPIGVAMAIPAVQLDVYMITEETQLFCCFMLFIGSAYSLGGDAFGAMMDEKGDAILKEHNAIEDVQIAAVETTLEAHKMMTTCQEDIKDVFAEQKELMDETVAAQTLALKHAVRNEVVAKLETIKQQETALANSVQATLVEAATDNIVTAFSGEGGDKLRAAALQQAIDALAGKGTGADTVGDMYSTYMKTFGSNLAAISGTDQALPAEVTKAIGDEIESIKRRDGLEFIDVTSPTSVKMNL